MTFSLSGFRVGPRVLQEVDVEDLVLVFVVCLLLQPFVAGLSQRLEFAPVVGRGLSVLDFGSGFAQSTDFVRFVFPGSDTDKETHLMAL
jgi:hypothetical protein